LRLGDPAERRHFAALEKMQFAPFAGEDVYEIQRMMNALDDAGGGIEIGDAAAQFLRMAVALGDEDGAGAGQLRRRLAQGSVWLQVSLAERLLAVDQHNVLPAAAQLPILKAVVEQQRVAAKFLDRI